MLKYLVSKHRLSQATTANNAEHLNQAVASKVLSYSRSSTAPAAMLRYASLPGTAKAMRLYSRAKQSEEPMNQDELTQLTTEATGHRPVGGGQVDVLALPALAMPPLLTSAISVPCSS